ncbi:hypothetical protein NE865_15517 [Phthorimaea operculella]|nr:hypothetical protein NE865_15517 [Phthorimaea operculella]
MNEQDTEIGKQIKKKATKDNKIKYDDHSYAFCNQTDKAICDNNPQSSDVNMSDFISVSDKPLVTKSEKVKKQVEHKVCDEWNSDSDFYWPDTDGEKAKTEQQLTESLNRKDKQRKAVKQKILSLDILTNSENEKVDEYQPDEDSSVMSDSNLTSENDDRVINYFSNTTTFECNICLKVFSDTKYLITHMKRCHTEEKNHICDRCAMKFWSKAELKRHFAFKHERKRYGCEMCKYKCATKEQLVSHKRMHTGERPYKCDKCEMTYPRIQSLQNHKKLHFERTIQCPQCPKMCHTKAALIKHFNSIHHRMYRYDCSLCDATYALKSTLKKHLTEKHGIAREDQGEIKKIELVSGHPENIIEKLSSFAL